MLRRTSRKSLFFENPDIPKWYVFQDFPACLRLSRNLDFLDFPESPDFPFFLESSDFFGFFRFFRFSDCTVFQAFQNLEIRGG